MILGFQPGLGILGKIGSIQIGLAGIVVADPGGAPAGPNMFSPASTPAHSIYHLAIFVLVVAAAIFLTVFSLLAYSVVRFGRRSSDDGREPPQVYGSNEVELAWTVLPVLILLRYPALQRFRSAKISMYRLKQGEQAVPHATCASNH